MTLPSGHPKSRLIKKFMALARIFEKSSVKRIAFFSTAWLFAST